MARWPAGFINDGAHTEDEVYHVTAADVVVVVAGEAAASATGLGFLRGGRVEHRFVEIAEDLDVVVFWSPARHANAPR